MVTGVLVVLVEGAGSVLFMIGWRSVGMCKQGVRRKERLKGESRNNFYYHNVEFSAPRARS